MHVSDNSAVSQNPAGDGPGVKIFLVGFMGSGKTYWGKLWAEKTGLQFFDLDAVIETLEGNTVESIFEKHGEAYFREKESSVLRSFAGNSNCIIACGGGTPCFHDNLQWMNDHGITLYLKASARRILNRVEDEKGKRPLLKKLNKAEILFFIEQKLKEREPFYNQAKTILSVEELDMNSIDDIINFPF